MSCGCCSFFLILCSGSCYENNEVWFDWSKLPDELTVEILCRLPEKPLIQFKCVSKAWYFLISNVCVPRIYASARLSGFLFHAYVREGFQYYVDYVSSDGSGGGGGGFVESYLARLRFRSTVKEVLDCRNGLLLVVKHSFPDQYYVFNPTTKQCVAIPVSSTHINRTYTALAFDPLESFGYKIVRLDRLPRRASVVNPVTLDVFSSHTGKWVSHSVLVEPELHNFGRITQSVYLNGVLYLLSADSQRHLFWFELKADDVDARAIKLPVKERVVALGFIGMSKGCFYYANHAESTILVWSLELSCSKAAEWILKHSISIDDLAQRPQGGPLKDYRLSRLLKPYALHPSLEVIFIGIPNMIFSYHLKTNQLNVFCDFGNNRYIGNGQSYVFPYTHCLVVLKDFTQRNLNQSIGISETKFKVCAFHEQS